MDELANESTVSTSSKVTVANSDDRTDISTTTSFTGQCSYSISFNSNARGSTSNASAESCITSNDSDKGYLDVMDINRSTCNDQERLNILQNNWKPPHHHTFPYRQFGEK